MPTPARTSIDEIVRAGRAILEADGIDGLTMQAVALAVGVRAPSLYKRVQGRSDLLRLIGNDIARELTAALDDATGSGDPRRDLRALAVAFRRFAKESPQAFSLLFDQLPEESRADPEWAGRTSAPLLRTAAALAGPDDALEAARTLVAWATGFISMELRGAFRLGGDVERAFDYGIDRLTLSISA